jgi:hypothetical protein
MPGSESRMQTTGVRHRDLACDLEQSLTVSFIFDGPGLDLWDALQLGDYRTLTVRVSWLGVGSRTKTFSKITNINIETITEFVLHSQYTACPNELQSRIQGKFGMPPRTTPEWEKYTSSSEPHKQSTIKRDCYTLQNRR